MTSTTPYPRLTHLVAVAFGIPYAEARDWITDYQFPPSNVEWLYLRDEIARAVTDRHGILTENA